MILYQEASTKHDLMSEPFHPMAMCHDFVSEPGADG
jgi:hypothetical protein